MNPSAFFNDWESIRRTVVVGTLAYAALVLLLRASGKRTLSKMNAFDLVVTVALGSTLATILLNADVSLAQGVAAFVTLVILQYMIAWAAVRSRRVRSLVKSEPRLLFFRGEFLHDALRSERVTEDEVRAAMRGEGVAREAGVEAVVLETDGSLSVLHAADGGAPDTLRGVTGYAG